MTETNAETVRGIYDALARGDIDHVVATFDDDIEWVEATGGPYGGTYHGPDAVVENVLGPLGEEWEEFVVDFERSVADDGTVVGLATYRGTYDETGESFEAPVAHVWDFEDGKVVRFQQYVDTVLHNAPLGER